MMKKEQKKGPDPDRLVLDDNWQNAMGKAIKKERPKEGWPEPEKKSDNETDAS